MARTTSDLVKSILLQDYDELEAPDLTPYIATANVIVTRVVACALAKDEALTDEEAELIERWLAAHYYVVSDQTYAAKATADASATFHGKTAMHIQSSRYGQSAIDIDASGCLAAIAAGTDRKVAGGFWAGRPPSEQTDYVDRD